VGSKQQGSQPKNRKGMTWQRWTRFPSLIAKGLGVRHLQGGALGVTGKEGAPLLTFGGHLTRDRALSIAGRKCLTGVENTLAHVQAPENCGGTRRSVKCRVA
jgi:hypothetical protein